MLNWHRQRKEVNRELHAMNGNTSSSVAPSHALNVRPRVDPANDDDMDLSLAPTIVVPPTMPRAADLSLEPNTQPGPVLADDDGTGALFEDPAVHTPPLDHPVGSQPAHTHTALEDRLERLFAQGRDLSSSLVRQEENRDEMGIVAAMETLKRYILTLVPAWQNRPIMLQVALGALAVFHLRPSDYTPVEEVNVLWALEGDSFLRAHGGVLFTYHGYSWRKFEGIFSSSALRRIKGKMMALEGLFRKRGTATARDRASIIRRIEALRTPRDAVDDPALDALWFGHLHAAATGAEPPRDGGDAPWTTQVIKAIIKCSTDMQNDLCGKRTVGNFVEWCDPPIQLKPGFATTDGCWVFAEPDGKLRLVAPRGSSSSCARRSSIMHRPWSASWQLCAGLFEG